MVANGHYTRIDIFELKAQIYQKLGHQKADKYFNQLTRLFSCKSTKSEFDKFCTQIIGRENISLHNQFIKSILKNASLSKVAPLRVRKAEDPGNVKFANGYQRNCLQSLYGDAISPNTRKGRSPVQRDRKFRDRPSPLGPLGKTPSLTSEEGAPRTQEQQSATLGSRPPVEVVSVEDGEEVEQVAGSPYVQSRSPVTAPFGISLNAGGGSRKALGNGFLDKCHPETCHVSGMLLDTSSLRTRLEQKLESEGLSVSMDCANVLNNGLDVFLKRLIEPCLELARSKQRCSSGNMQNVAKPICGSMLDFRVAMESNTQIMGPDRAIQLEKIWLRDEARE